MSHANSGHTDQKIHDRHTPANARHSRCLTPCQLSQHVTRKLRTHILKDSRHTQANTRHSAIRRTPVKPACHRQTQGTLTRKPMTHTETLANARHYQRLTPCQLSQHVTRKLRTHRPKNPRHTHTHTSKRTILSALQHASKTSMSQTNSGHTDQKNNDTHTHTKCTTLSALKNAS